MRDRQSRNPGQARLQKVPAAVDDQTLTLLCMERTECVGVVVALDHGGSPDVAAGIKSQEVEKFYKNPRHRRYQPILSAVNFRHSTTTRIINTTEKPIES